MSTKPQRRFTAARAENALAAQDAEHARVVSKLVVGALEEYHKLHIVGWIAGTRRLISRLSKRAARRDAKLAARLTLAEKRADLAQVQTRLLCDQNVLLVDRLGEMEARLDRLERPWWRRIGR